LLAKIALSTYIVIESALCIHPKIFNVEKLSRISRDKDQIEYQHFKPMIMSLFGQNLFTLSLVDIDSILRKVHRELINVIGDEAKPACKDQKCGTR
jgi:hypothetical protein